MSRKGRSQLDGFIDQGSHLHGELHFEHTFRVDGELTGGVRSKGDLYVGERGVVRGDIQVGRLFVSGRAEGSVVAAIRVEIAPGGRLLAEVVTPCLVIEEGAFFEGQSRMVEEPRAAAGTQPGTVAQLRRGEGAAAPSRSRS